MKYQITLEGTSDGKVRIEFKPSVDKVMANIRRTQKCNPAEEMLLLAFEAWKKRKDEIDAKRRQQRGSASGIIIPDSGLLVPEH